MKVIESKEYTQIKEAESSKQIFDAAMRLYNRDKEKAARAVLDSMAGRSWENWDIEKAKRFKKNIINRFSEGKTKIEKKAFMPGRKLSLEEQWKKLGEIAEGIMKIYNENDLGRKEVKCWIQQKGGAQGFYDIFISHVDDSGKEDVVKLIDNGSYETSKKVLMDVYVAATMRLMSKPKNEPKPPSDIGYGGDFDIFKN